MLSSAKLLSKSEQKSINEGLFNSNCQVYCTKAGGEYNGKYCRSATCGKCVVVCY